MLSASVNATQAATAAKELQAAALAGKGVALTVQGREYRVQVSHTHLDLRAEGTGSR